MRYDGNPGGEIHRDIAPGTIYADLSCLAWFMA
jgi:hypothetical protein